MRTFLKTTRESDCVIKSLLSFFARFWGSFSLFFFVSLSLFCSRARARVSLSLLLSPRTTHQGGEEDFGDALDDDDENK